MKDRLIRLLDSEQLTASKFADKIGVQRSSVSHVLSGRNKPSFDFVQKTLLAFPEVNADWLMLGKGTMITGVPDSAGATLFDRPEEPDQLGLDEKEDLVSEPAVDGAQTTSVEISQSTDIHHSEGPVDDDSNGTETKIPEKRVVRVMMFYEDNTFQSFDPVN